MCHPKTPQSGDYLCGVCFAPDGGAALVPAAGWPLLWAVWAGFDGFLSMIFIL